MKAHIPNTSHFSYISIGALCLLTIATSVFVGVASSSGEIASFDNSASDMADELKLFQQMPLVITAARKPQSTTEAPATIDVITAENIRRSGALTLTELLEQLPGIYTPTAHNALDMLWIRGVGGRFNDNALLLIDGVPYRTLYFSNFPINEQIPLEDIQRIEVVRGPGSALYGTNAFTGVINILTKDTADIESNEVSVSYGSWNTQNHYLLAGKQFKNAEVNLFAKYLDSDGYKVGQDDEGNSTDERRGAHNDAYKLKLKYNNLDLSLRYSKFTLNDFTSVPGDEEGGESIREHLLSRLGYHRDFGRRLSLQFTAYLNIYNLDKSRMAFDEDLSLR